EVGTTIRMEELDADGKVIHVGESGRETWENLKNHATFPVKDARFIKHRQESTALGELDCVVYEMLEPQSGVVKTRFVFAYDFPGPPILFTQYADGAEVMRFEMIDR